MGLNIAFVAHLRREQERTAVVGAFKGDGTKHNGRGGCGWWSENGVFKGDWEGLLFSTHTSRFHSKGGPEHGRLFQKFPRFGVQFGICLMKYNA